MKIADFLAETELPSVITYQGGPIGPTSDFEDCVEARLYVRNMAFLKWFLRPETYFSDGGVAVRAYDGEQVIGIGVLNAKAWWFRAGYHPRIDDNTQQFLGMVGFFVKEEYRARGVAQNIAKHLEQEILKSYRDLRTPAVLCTGAACPVSRVFTKIAAIPVA